MNPGTYIDAYCERTAPGLWAEPLNALTNISFFIAAFLLLRLARNRADRGVAVLAGLVAVIGAGSTLFHTFATYWAMLADTLPILLFQVTFLLLYARHVMVLGRAASMGLLAGFFAAIYGFGALPAHWLNGSLSYAPALLFLAGLGAWHWRRAARERGILLLAAGIFTLSLSFRSLDMAFCATIGMGLHFLWHLLNGVVLYLSARGYALGRNT